jgi:hypothetical protein
MSASIDKKFGFVDYYVDSELAVLTMPDAPGGNRLNKDTLAVCQPR